MSSKIPDAYKLPVHKVGEAPWSADASKILEDLKKREASAPKANIPSGKGRKTRRQRRARKSKYTRRR